MWNKLIEVLEKISAVYDGLAELGEKKRSALVAVDMKALSNILDQEQIIAAKIQNLEQQRGAVLLELSTGNSKIGTDIKATDFYKTAPSPEISDKLLEVHKQLTQNVERTLKISRDNQVLAQAALDAVTFKLNRLNGAFIEPNYGAKGSIVTHQKKFDYQA